MVVMVLGRRLRVGYLILPAPLLQSGNAHFFVRALMPCWRIDRVAEH